MLDLTRVLVLVLIACMFSNCKKFVQVNPPSTQLVTSSVFNDDAAATAAQIEIYTEMASKGESSTMEQNTGFLSDELTYYSASTKSLQFYTNAMTATSTVGPWGDAYSYIYQANAIISGLTNNPAISPVVDRQLLGEAKFIRAFWLFYLSSLYGDVPLILTTDYTTNAAAPRVSKAKVYQQMITDLSDAIGLLNSNYIDASDTTVTTERTRPTKWAAAALLARIYLYSGDYANAVAQANSVIGNSQYRLLGVQNDSVFQANSMEAIWQLAIPQPNGYEDTPDAFFFTLTSAPSGSPGCNCSISPELLQSFEPGDYRRNFWVDSIQAGSSTYYFPFKYQVNTPSTQEYIMVLRLAEQYLIRAEAEAQLNNLTAAATDLNSIRSRAGLANIDASITNSQQGMISAILHERQVELFAEWGHRWIDLGRSGVANSVMSVVTPQKGGKWDLDGHQLLFPIPQSEITVDANLTQNGGY